MFEIQSHAQVISHTNHRNGHSDENTIVVGIVIPRTGSLIFNDYYLIELIQGIAEECNKKEYTVILYLFHSRDNKQALYERLLKTGQCDGLIVSATHAEDPLFAVLTEKKFKFVTIGKQPDLPDISYVDVGNIHGAETAVNHLIHRGYTRIATINGPLDQVAAFDRQRGYLNAMRANNLPLDKNLIVEGHFTEHGGYQAMKELLNHQPEAVFIASDTMALGALMALEEVGLTVPEDIAIVGFDNIKTAQITSPPLTTIKQPINETGKIAVSLLLDILEKENKPPQHTLLETELVVRQSCGSQLQI